MSQLSSSDGLRQAKTGQGRNSNDKQNGGHAGKSLFTAVV